MEAVETGAGGASGVEATLDVGAALGAAFEAKGLEKGSDGRRVGLGKAVRIGGAARQPDADQPGQSDANRAAPPKTPSLPPPSSDATAPRRATNAANSLIGPTHSYATQLAGSFVRTS